METTHHVPVHHSSSEEILEDPFDDDIEATFPPERYFAKYFPQAQPPTRKLRRESSMERARLYRELVGHDPYSTPMRRFPPAKTNDFRANLDVKHYTPDEITLKVEGNKLIVSGSHFHSSDFGFDKSEFRRTYTIPEHIEKSSLTSTITPDGVLLIKAVSKDLSVPEEFSIFPKDADEDKFKVTLDVNGYQPNDIKIHVNDRYLIVTAERKEQKTDEHGSSAHHQRYERKFSISADVDSDLISSRYRDGKITIEAPQKKGGVETQMRKLEIKEENV